MKKISLMIATLLLTISAFAQNVTIKGSVSDAATGERIQYASVVVKGGGMIGTSTDDAGDFTITVPKGSTLMVSFIGYETKEVAVGNATVLNVELTPSAEGLDDVIVVAYQTTTARSFTGAATSMKSEDMSAQRTSLVQSMDGKVAGVRVGAATGDPGADQNIQIRGIGSVNGSTQPLYVVDGIPLQNDGVGGSRNISILSTLNPDDIANMTILKDAAAASLYGSRAANGVIVITTKKGSAGKTKITYDGEVGASSIAVRTAIQPMNAEQTKQYYLDGYTNYYIYQGQSPDKALESAKAKVKGYFKNYDNPANTDWGKEVYRTGVTTNHQVTLSGGDSKTTFYASAGYNKVNGTVKASDFERFSGRINLDHSVNSWLKVGVKQMITYTNTNGFSDKSGQSSGFSTASPLSILYASDPTAAVKLPDGSYNPNIGFSKAANINLMQTLDVNPYSQFVKTNTVRSLTNADIQVKFPAGFTAKTIFGYDYTSTRNQTFWAPDSIDGQSLSGSGSRNVRTGSTLTSSTTLNWANTFGLHNIQALAGWEVENRKTEYVSASVTNYPTYKLPELSNGIHSGASSSVSSGALLSFLANANYDYDGKYYLSASFRRDGSSRLAKENRWSNFWSVSAAWRISSEEFLKGIELFHDLKLRASYGTNGNLPSGYYSYQGQFSTSSAYNGDKAYVWSNLANPTLGWEKSASFNVGLDWNLYGRLGITVEYYNKLTKDLLFEMPTSYVTGFGSKMSNIGNLRNSGFEITLNSINIRNKNFSWETDFNITFQKNIVVSLPNHEDVLYGHDGMYLLREGESMHTFYVPIAKGLNDETGLMEFWADPEDHSKGVVTKWADAKPGIAGKAVPDILGGMTNTINWKGLDFSFMFTFQTGSSLFDYPGYFLENSDGVRIGSFAPMAIVAGKYWTGPGQGAVYPKPIANNPYRSDKFSSRTIVKNDNVRMRDITLGYTLPVKKSVFNRLRLYVRATNPFLIYNAAKVMDPDVTINGYRTTDTPPTRSFVFGVNFVL
ncbi:MAG: TonB-dependent receptor [Bacteroidales bacterium]|nr:TonB-dependent receptor [Bacteroidales bacterium]